MTGHDDASRIDAIPAREDDREQQHDREEGVGHQLVRLLQRAGFPHDGQALARAHDVFDLEQEQASEVACGMEAGEVFAGDAATFEQYHGERIAQFVVAPVARHGVEVVRVAPVTAVLQRPEAGEGPAVGGDLDAVTARGCAVVVAAHRAAHTFPAVGSPEMKRAISPCTTAPVAGSVYAPAWKKNGTF